jgi:hypothetical protein
VIDRESAESSASFGAALKASKMVFAAPGGTIILGGSQATVTGTVGWGSPASGRRPGVIGEAELRHVAQTFEPARDYRALRKLLKEQHVVVLSAEPGWGRTATALFLLYECLTDSTAGVGRVGEANQRTLPRVSRLATETDLRGEPTRVQLGPPADTERAPAGGYLLDVAEPAGADQLRGSDLELLAGLASASGHYLVVTTDAGMTFGDSLAAFRLEARAWPQEVRVVARHAALRLGRPFADVLRDIEADGALLELIEQLVSEGYSAAGLAELGRLWAEGTQIRRLRAWVSGFLDRRFLAWVSAAGQEREHQALVIGLAVFNGMPYARVTRLARDLEARMLAASRRFMPVLVDNRADRDAAAGLRGGQRLFTNSRATRLEAARAEVRLDQETTLYGTLDTEVVAFRYDSYSVRVLRWLWTEQDGMHEVLLGWLAALGGDIDPSVRVRAAAAVGVLASWSFDDIRQRVLVPWADADKPWLREAVAAALNLALGQRPELAPMVTAMLRHWKLHVHAPQRRRAAIRAWGTRLGDVSPKVALDQLTYLLAPEKDEDEDLDPDTIPLGPLLDAALSVFDMFMSESVVDDEGRQTLPTAQPGGPVDEIVRRLLHWAMPERDGGHGGVTIRLAGLLSFLRLALHARVPAGPNPDGRSVLLALCMQRRAQQRLLGRVGVLWHLALDEPVTADVALDCLRRWAADAEADEADVRAALAAVVVASVHSDLDRERVTGEFRRWKKRWPAVCTAVLDEIEKRWPSSVRAGLGHIESPVSGGNRGK